MGFLLVELVESVLKEFIVVLLDFFVNGQFGPADKEKRGG